MTTNGKPRKSDFADMREFMRAAAEWANANDSRAGGAPDIPDAPVFR